MTPQERQLIDDLFDRLAKLESAQRDPEAMSAIMQGLRNAPNAVYALVQTALVQDEALKRADSRIQELEAAAGQQNQSGGFLDSMRDAIFGQNQPQGTARCPTFARPRWPAAVRPGTPARCCSRTRRPDNMASRPTRQPYGGAAAAAVGVRRRWRLVPRHRGGGRGRRGRRLAAGRQHPLDDGRRRQPPELRRHRGPSRRHRRPQAVERSVRRRPGARRRDQRHRLVAAGAPTTDDDGSRAGLLRSGARTTTTTTWITIPTASTATTATAITPERMPDPEKRNGRPIGRPFRFRWQS